MYPGGAAGFAEALGKISSEASQSPLIINDIG